MKAIVPKNLSGRLPPAILFMCLFTSASGQDFIINYTPCNISDELVVSPKGKIMLYDVSFKFQKLSTTYIPEGEIVYMEPEGYNKILFGATFYSDNDLAVFWTRSEWVDDIYWYYLYAKQFDTLGNIKVPETKVDSCQQWYSAHGVSKTTDPDNELGLAFVSNDTLFAMYYNPETNTCSKKKVLLTGSGTSGIETVDFLPNTDVRVIWRDVNKYVRHKRLAKSGETLITHITT